MIIKENCILLIAYNCHLVYRIEVDDDSIKSSKLMPQSCFLVADKAALFKAKKINNALRCYHC